MVSASQHQYTYDQYVGVGLAILIVGTTAFPILIGVLAELISFGK